MENIIINVNSLFRDKEKYPLSTKFNYELPTDFKYIIKMNITSLEVPNIVYIISEYRNNNKFKLINNELGISKTIILKDGNYTSSNLVLYLNDDIFTDELKSELGVSILLSEIDPITGFLMFSSDKDITIDYTRENNCNSEYENLNYYFGFSNEINNSVFNIKNLYYEITGDSVVNFVGTNYIFLKINEINNIVDKNVSDAFAKFILNSGKYTVHFEDSSSFVSKEKIFRSPQNITNLNVELVDYLGNPINLQEHNFSFTLELTYIYDINIFKYLHNYDYTIPNVYNRFQGNIL
jgi:hypothetical protein